MRFFRLLLKAGVVGCLSLTAAASISTATSLAHQHPDKSTYTITFHITNHIGWDMQLLGRSARNPNYPKDPNSGHFSLWHWPRSIRNGMERTISSTRKGWEGIRSHLVFAERGNAASKMHVDGIIRDNGKGVVLESAATVWETGKVCATVTQEQRNKFVGDSARNELEAWIEFRPA